MWLHFPLMRPAPISSRAPGTEGFSTKNVVFHQLQGEDSKGAASGFQRDVRDALRKAAI